MDPRLAPGEIQAARAGRLSGQGRPSAPAARRRAERSGGHRLPHVCYTSMQGKRQLLRIARRHSSFTALRAGFVAARSAHYHGPPRLGDAALPPRMPKHPMSRDNDAAAQARAAACPAVAGVEAAMARPPASLKRSPFPSSAAGTPTGPRGRPPTAAEPRPAGRQPPTTFSRLRADSRAWHPPRLARRCPKSR